MGLLDRLALRLGYAPARPSRPVNVSTRGFKAAKSDRLTASWTLSDVNINADIYQHLRVMRARSRDLFANNAYARNFATLLRNNVVGPRGMTFRSRARRADNGEVDREDNARIEAAYADFSRAAAFTVTGRMDRRSAEAMLIETWARDGEVLALKRHGAQFPHGMAIQFLDVDRLDLELNQPLDRSTGRQIIMGVECDEDLRPVAYHILTRHPEGDVFTQTAPPTRKHQRVPAEDVIHLFKAMRPEQVRGVPWLHAGMLALWDTQGWSEAALIAARLGANKLGFIKGPQVGDEDAGGALEDYQDALGERISASEPGEWHVLGPDDEVETYDPTYPHAMFSDFNKAMLRGVAASMGVAYFSLANDQESVNFSSAKIGLAPERDLYMCLQEDIADGFHASYYPDWLRIQLVTGRLAPIPQTQEALARNNRGVWKGRRWLSTEPLKDAQADALKIGMRLVSARRLMEQQGLDPDEEWAVMSEDMAQWQELGIQPTLPGGVQFDIDQGASDEQ